MSPDRVLRQAARILQADPAMWDYLRHAMGETMAIPFVMREGGYLTDQRVTPLRTPQEVMGWVVFYTDSDGELRPPSINVPGYSGEVDWGGPDVRARTIDVENYAGKISVNVFALGVGGPSHRIDIPPLDRDGEPREFYPPGFGADGDEGDL